MSGLSTERLIDAVVAGIAAGGARRGVPLGWRMGAAAAASALAVVAASFLIAAAYLSLATRIEPAAAAALVGAGALVLALAVVLGLWLAGRVARRRNNPGLAIESQGKALLATLSDEVRDHPHMATLAALVAGAVIGANPGLQDEALRLLAQASGRGESEGSSE